MIAGETAVEMIHALIQAEVDVVNQNCTDRGISKKALKAEASAARNLFLELTGSEPTDEQIKEMVDL